MNSAPLPGAGEADIDLRNQLRRVQAAIEVWAQAVKIAGSLQAPAVARVLHKSEFATALGPVSFDRKGDIQGPAAQWQWFRAEGGRMVPASEE